MEGRAGWWMVGVWLGVWLGVWMGGVGAVSVVGVVSDGGWYGSVVVRVSLPWV